MSKKPKQSEPAQLQSIDPTQLEKVAGGAARVPAADANSEVMTALTGVLDSLNSLKSNQQSSGFGPNEMMMFMMMLGGGRQAPVVQQAASPYGGYAGYTIDGVFYPFK
jgi:hypothetical protein